MASVALSLAACESAKKVMSNSKDAPDEFVVVIDPTSNTSVHTADECGRSPLMRPGQPPHSYCTHDHSHAPPHEHGHGCSHAHDHAHATKSKSATRGSKRADGVTLSELLLPPDAASASQ